eukprot:Skav208833  [mRNA]  locus=scaffold1193:49015:53454:- [translate_table: standard]
MEIEPVLRSHRPGEIVDVVVVAGLSVEGGTLATTMIHQTPVFVKASLIEGQKYTLFQVKVWFQGDQTILEQTNASKLHQHKAWTPDMFDRHIEVCAGLGAVTAGFQKAGVQCVQHVEENQTFVAWLSSHGKPVMHGDINDVRVVRALAEYRVGFLTGGVSCQPFSRLGDGREHLDERSKSMVGFIRAIYLLQIPVSIMECTPTAHTSTWVQNMLTALANGCQMTVHQELLDIQDIWPAKRNRWWCTIAHKDLSIQPIPKFPAFPFKPAVVHLLPHFMHLPMDELKQLQLDLHELHHFHTRPNLQKHLVDWTKALPTATHAWGSQLSACPCKCRSAGFTLERLDSKGLYGQLVLTGGTIRNGTNEYCHCRHLHPKEVALMNGWTPDHVGGPQAYLKLELAGTGQLASPLQGGWVMANVRHDLHVQGWVPQDTNPGQMLYAMTNELIAHRDALLQITNDSGAMRIFRDAMRQWNIGQPVGEEPDEIPVAPSPTKVPMPEFCVDRQEDLDRTHNQLEPSTPQGGLFANPAALLHSVVTDGPVSQESISHMAVHDFFAKADEELTEEVPSPDHKRPRTEELTQETQDDQSEGEVTVFLQGEGLHSFAFSGPLDVQTLGDAINGFYDLECVDITSAMGTPLSPESQVVTGQVLRCLTAHATTSEDPPILVNVLRTQALWQQMGWTAVDEMRYYMQGIECSYPSSTTDLAVVSAGPEAFTDMVCHILRSIAITGEDMNTSQKAFVVLRDQHWVPFLIRIGAQVEIWTSSDYIQRVTHELEVSIGDHGFALCSRDVPHVFPHDCGFQAIAWIIGLLAEEEDTQPFTVQKAGQWRAAFHKFLCDQGDDDYVLSPLVLGGGNSVKEALQKLVVQHGVNFVRSSACADQLIQALGPHTLQQILQSPKPWHDLKARANLHQPPLKIVMADELKAMIEQRATDGKQVGRKQNKIKSKEPPPPLAINTDQFAVPPGVFKQEDGVELSQVSVHTLGQQSQGIVLVNVDDAAHLLQLQRPMSQEGLALVIPEHDDTRLPPQRVTVKVPIQCKATNEPAIITAALLQIGTKRVSRNVPAQCVEVPEVDTEVIRLVVYKDQCQHDWSQFTKGPVKAMLQDSPFAAALGSQELVDVWDRQYLTMKLTKCSPAEADLFCVNVRVHAKVAKLLHAANSTDGHYAEPRTPDGRQHCPQYAAVWLPQKNFAEAALAQRMSTTPVQLIRSGTRFGLRVPQQHAEQVHRAHRPDLVYLQGSEIKRFRVGPFPYGSTKQSLGSVFTKWGWKARAVSPVGQAQDRSGVMWFVQSHEPPAFFVWQCSHGDVLIAEEQSGTTGPAVKSNILAPPKTMQSIKADQVPVQKQGGNDPWLTKDPWQPRSKEISVGQIAALEANLEQKILQKIQTIQEDEPMPEAKQDARLSALEQQVEQLGQSMSTMQQSQAQHVQYCQSQFDSHNGILHKLDAKIDAHQHNMTTMIDNKLDEQLNRIDRLLAQRPKHGE